MVKLDRLRVICSFANCVSIDWDPIMDHLDDRLVDRFYDKNEDEKKEEKEGVETRVERAVDREEDGSAFSDDENAIGEMHENAHERNTLAK